MHSRSVNYTFILDMSKILDNIFVWVFSVNSESILLLAAVKYKFIVIVLKTTFLYFLEAKNPCFVTKNCWKSSYICLSILSQNRAINFSKNLQNSGMVGRRKLPDPLLNCMMVRWPFILWLLYNIRSHFNELILAWSASCSP